MWRRLVLKKALNHPDRPRTPAAQSGRRSISKSSRIEDAKRCCPCLAGKGSGVRIPDAPPS